MEKKRAPSERRAQELPALLQGQLEGQSGKELLSMLVRLSTERVLQEALEQEQAEALGRGRSERREQEGGYRNGYESGTLKTAEGVLRVQLPQIRGREEPYRSELWSQMARTSDVLKRLIVERYAGGLSPREIEYGLEKALGQFVLAKSAVSELTDTLTQEYEAFRTRDLSGYEVAYLLMDAVYEPWRRWGSKTGVFCVWASCVEGRKVLLSLSTAKSESFASCRGVLRDLVKRGLRPPATVTTDGAVGLTQALDAVWPKALRMRCWLHSVPRRLQTWGLQRASPAKTSPAGSWRQSIAA